jgi:hypothetical protein
MEWWGSKHAKGQFLKKKRVEETMKEVKSLVKGCEVSTQGGLIFGEKGWND